MRLDDLRRRLAPSEAGRSLLAAVLTFALLVTLVEIWLRHADFYDAAIESSGYLSRPHKFQRFREPLDVIATGSSRVRAGVSTPELWRAGLALCGRPIRAYNLGVSGGFGRAELAMATQVVARRKGGLPKLALLYLHGTAASTKMVAFGTEASIGHTFASSGLPSMIRGGLSPDQVAVSTIAGAPFELVRLRQQLLRYLKGRRLRPDNREVPYFRGWVPFRPTSTTTQQRRMLQKSREQATYFDGSKGAKYTSVELRAFEEAVRLLRAHGVTVVLLDEPVSSKMHAAARGTPIHRRYLAEMRAMARRHGATFVNHGRPRGIVDSLYRDHTHLSVDGARQYSRLLAEAVIAPALRCVAPPRPVCAPLPELAPSGWARQGTASVAPPPARDQSDWLVGSGAPMLWTGAPDRTRGRGDATSPHFVVSKPNLVLEVAGGGGRAFLELLLDGRRVERIDPGSSPVLHPTRVLVGRWQGRRLQLRLVDRDPHGFVAFEGAMQCGRY